MQNRRLLVVFDFDGVIVDSLPALFDSYLGFLRDFDVIGTIEEFQKLNGPSLKEIILYLKKKYNIKLNFSDLNEKYINIILERYNDVKINEGLIDIIHELKRLDIDIALASSSRRDIILETLDANNILPYFSFIITGDEILHSKPSPDIYLRVKEKFNNHNYLVVEDSLNGLLAASRAEMDTIFFNPKKNITSNSKYQIQSFNQIIPIVEEYRANCFTVFQSNNININITKGHFHISNGDVDIADKIWLKNFEKEKIYNGKILSYISHDLVDGCETINCAVTDYKYFYAQHKNKDLNYNIFPIGVSAIILDDDGNTIIGKRRNVTQYNGSYEFVPSGSLDPSLDENTSKLIYDQVLIELKEELGLDKLVVKKIEPLCLIYDKNDHVYDLCFKIYLNRPISGLSFSLENDEYSEIIPINISEIDIHEKDFVPTSRILSFKI